MKNSARAATRRHSGHLGRILRGLALAAVGLIAVGAAAVPLPAEPAQAAGPTVVATVEGRPDLVNVADNQYLTTLDVSGSGFVSKKNGFGGVYVLFGWAGQNWKPSTGGVDGIDRKYVYDDESNPTGYMLFVSFPGSETQYAANGGLLNADGTWHAKLMVPGPTFQYSDRDGNKGSVNCLETQCGIMTVGAHGVKEPANESFTPISFQHISDSGRKVDVQAGTTGQTSAQGKTLEQQATGGSAGVTAPDAADARPATVPTSPDPAALTDDNRGDLQVTVRDTQLKVTDAAADPASWTGFFVMSDPRFTGWSKPNSVGEFDVRLPDDVADGEHRLVAVNAQGDVTGWTTFDTSGQTGAVSTTDEQPAPNTPLIIAAVVVGVIALLVIALLIFVLLRRRRRQPAQED
ncbi:EGFR-like transmembrane domain-containing protein [Pseudoclavibacter sp. 13-3]|uniref:EGFR-like transmembrane domain-containing protein n=1 Tax=Pseudoclavibacter sp. 13-3 TaxID=2901228 RepID=UPI001E3E162C|nr:transmembrane domain-containing protein [Pseudoclavibacter sp. 13-3]MCD7100994.1 transmembrane domain-containing protein [Pseudoclavibacter sp. 13-3]